MAIFLYSGITSTGKEISGELTSSSADEVKSLLRKKRIRPTMIKKKPIEINLKIGSGVKFQEIARMTRQFSTMVSAGLPLIQCLDILSSQTPNPHFQKVISRVSLDVQGGNTLSDSLRKHPKLFSELYCHMVSAGEAGGILDGILNRLAGYMEKADALHRKIKGAMIYPAVIAVVALGSISFLLTFVVPTFANMFKELGGELPAPTRIVMNISSFLRTYFLLIFAAIIGFVTALSYYYKTPNGRLQIDKFKLKIPVFGDLERKSSISRFSRTLGTLLRSGVSIIDSLMVTSKTSGNRVVELGITKTIESISGGQTIADPLRETGVFPPMVVQMISVGEKTGQLDEMLEKISDFYDEEVNAAVESMTSIIEPVVIVIMGVIIGAVLIAMYMPMFDMIGQFG